MKNELQVQAKQRMIAAVERWQKNSGASLVTAAYSPAQVAKTDAPKLRELSAVLGVRIAEIAVKDQLNSFLRYAGADWPDDLLEECAYNLAHSNGHLSMAQWLYFWKRCKAGHYKWYGGIRALSPMVVEGWMVDHAAECEHENEQLQIQTDKQHDPREGVEVWEGLSAAIASLTADMREQKAYDEAAEDEEIKRRQERIARRRAEWEGSPIPKTNNNAPETE